MKRILALAGIIGVMVCFLVVPMTGCAKKTVVKEETATAEQKAAAERKAAEEREALRAKAAKDASEAKKSQTEMVSRAEATEAVVKDDKMMRDINFDFDKYILGPEAREILKGHVAWLANNSDYKIIIEGHCDERGTTEYNLALGERRAAEAMKYLAGLGIDAKRMKTVSYGKEMPLDSGHTEEAWAKNRRDHFVVVTPKK